jgi:hypothetical protein
MIVKDLKAMLEPFADDAKVVIDIVLEDPESGMWEPLGFRMADPPLVPPLAVLTEPTPELRLLVTVAHGSLQDVIRNWS